MCKLLDMDYEQLASELARALRGKRSQLQLSRRLGYKGNVIYTWESGRCFPTAARFLQAVVRINIDLDAALRRFYNGEPPWLISTDPTTPQGVAALLSDLRGRTPIGHLAEATGLSRFAISRILRAVTEPRLPDFLRILEATSLRMVDFIALLFDPEEIPSIAETWRDLEASRSAAYDAPWSLAVMLALELEEYKQLPRHVPGWIAERIGITLQEEESCIELLQRSRQIRMANGCWVVQRALTVDTRRDPGMGRALRRWWSQVAVERIDESGEGIFSYNLCSVSQEDYERLQELHRAYFRQVRTIVSQSKPIERLVLLNAHLFGLDRPVKAASNR